MKKIVRTGIVAFCAVMTVLVLIGCPQTEAAKNTEAILSAISIGQAVPTEIPTPISWTEWHDDTFDLTTAATSSIETVAGSTTISVIASGGAEVMFATVVNGSTDRPTEWLGSEEIEFRPPQQLYVRVTAENGGTINYYRFGITRLRNLSALSSVTIAGVETSSLGTPNAAANLAAAGLVLISDLQKTDAKVEVAGPPTASVKYAKVTGDAEPAFGDADTFTFADGDFVYIEVTAEDQVTKSVYKIEVGIGRSTALESIAIGGANVSNRGTPGTTETVVAGLVLAREPMPTEGFDVMVEKVEPNQTVKYAHATDATVPATFTDTINKTGFTDGGFLWIAVTSANGKDKAYYKIAVHFRQTVQINYAQPVIKASSEKYIDPIWNNSVNGQTIQTLQINKIYPGDSGGYTGNTTATAKLLYDEDGIYAYIEVKDSEISTTDDAHNTDSIEFFTNEDFANSTTGSYNGKGGQFRIGANGTLTGSQAIKSSVWKDDDGYVAIFQVPWVNTTTYPLEDGKKVGIEIQLNVAGASGGRQAVIVWNNFVTSNYNQVSGFGIGTLALNGNKYMEPPVVSVQPVSANYPLNAATVAPLSVDANSPDDGVISYQWYEADSYGEDGTEITGATAKTYTPTITTTATGTKWYYAAITNTHTDGTVKKTVKSHYAKIFVVNSAEVVERLSLNNGSFALYRIDLPAGAKWSDYTKITVEYKVDAANLAKKPRAVRLMGNYQPSQFTAGTSNGQPVYRLAMANAVNAPYILHDEGTAVFEGKSADTWFTVEYLLDGSKANTGYAVENKPAAAATGPFLFCLGISSENAAADVIVHDVKNVTLTNADGTKKVVSTGSGFSGAAFIGYGAGDVIRDIQ